jgi:NAD(P)-dependent dehydrogenase (short-subunit alcohol dehydrogenase family)
VELKGKTILITGASGGIGSAVARICDAEGASLVLHGRNEDRLNELQKSLKGNTHKLFLADLDDESRISQLSEQVGELDGIVHCAGIVLPVPVKFIREKHLKEVFRINLESPVLLTSSLFHQKKINNGASIVFISSVSSEHPYFGGGLYVASKAGLEAFSRTIALEYASKKIRSNVVAPGLVRTAIFEATEAAASEEEMKKYELQYPLGFGEPEDVANAVAFFLSDRSKWITGTKLTIDGGLTLGSKK